MAKISDERVSYVLEGIKMSEAVNKNQLEPKLNEAVSRYTGNYIPEIGSDWDVVINEIYPVVQNHLPSIFFRNPKAYLKPRQKTFIAKVRNPVSGRMEETQVDSEKSARTQEAILNYSLEEIKYKQEARKVLLDSLLFPYGVMWHGYKGNFGMTEEQAMFVKDERVFVRRINPMMFHWDRAYNLIDIEESSWMGRSIDVPLNDILDDDKLDVDKKALKGFEGFGNVLNSTTSKDSRRVSMINFTSDEFRKSNSCKFIRVHEVYLRPTKKEKREGKNGWILLLTEDQKKPLRVSEWKVKAEGYPGKILEFNPLNDAMFGIADIDTYKAIADQKNAIFNLQLRNAQMNTKLFVGINKEGIDGEDAIEQVVQGTNTIVFFNGDTPVGDRMRVFSGNTGASQELYTVDQRIQRNIEDKSSITDLKRGFLQSGEESAASVKLRAAGGSARPQYRQDIMKDFVKTSIHYINQLNKQFVTMEEAVRIMGTLDLQWSENLTKEELQADTDVEIDAVSMLPENPQDEIQQLNSTLSLAVQALQVPAILNKLKEEGKVFNLSSLIEKLLIRQKINDPHVFRNIEPQESMGFVSVQQLREAQANIVSVLRGEEIQFPPQEGDDHVAKLEVYSNIKFLLEAMQQRSEALEQIIQLQAQLLQAEQEKNTKAGQTVNLKPGKEQGI